MAAKALLAAMLLASTIAAAATSPQRIIARAAEAHGGGDRIGALRTLQVEWQVTDIWARQSRRPDPPWDRSTGSRGYALDLTGRRYVERVRQQFAGGYDFHYQVLIDGPHSELASYIDGYRRPLSPEEFPDRSAELVRSTPLLVLRQLLGRPGEAEYLGRTSIDERSFEALSFALRESEPPVELQFDARNGRLAGLTHRSDGREQRIVFADYAEHGGLWSPRTFRIYDRGELAWDVRVESIHYNEPIDAFLGPVEALPKIEIEVAAGVRDFAVRRIDDGVYFIGEGVHYQLFVEFDEYVVALGSVAGVERRLAALAERTGGKPLRYAIVTHHHDDHLEGVAALAEAGAVLITAPGHEAIVRRRVGEGRGAEIETVADRRTLGSGRQRIVVLQIGPNIHAEQMLIAYLPGSRLLWSADMFVQPPERPIRAAIGPIFDLAEAIRRHGLEVALLLDPHSPRLNSIEDLRTSQRRGTVPRDRPDE